MTAAYAGSELELFERAWRWKAYWADLVRPYLGAEVLEVGAGIGANTRVLRGDQRRWVCLEPDPGFCDRLRADAPGVEVRCGTTADLDPGERFDTLLYIDVLEHIADDGAELARAAALLRPGGHVVAVSPAHEWLYSPFDQQVGHHRRYRLADLVARAPSELTAVDARYLDAVGLLASAGNRLALRQRLPELRQILFWDRVLVPASRRLDPWLRYRLGKSVFVAWRR